MLVTDGKDRTVLLHIPLPSIIPVHANHLCWAQHVRDTLDVQLHLNTESLVRALSLVVSHFHCNVMVNQLGMLQVQNFNKNSELY
jgi:hypothetical protein